MNTFNFDEKDRFFEGSDAVTAIYYNPQGNDERGTFMQHTFDYDYIMEMNEKYPHTPQGDEDFWDSLYGDAFHCKTYCIDSGTDYFDGICEDMQNGKMLEDDSRKNIREYLVDTAKKHIQGV